MLSLRFHFKLILFSILPNLPEPGTLQIAHSGAFRLGKGAVNSFVGCSLSES